MKLLLIGLLVLTSFSVFSSDPVSPRSGLSYDDVADFQASTYMTAYDFASGVKKNSKGVVCYHAANLERSINRLPSLLSDKTPELTQKAYDLRTHYAYFFKSQVREYCLAEGGEEELKVAFDTYFEHIHNLMKGIALAL